MAMEPRKLKRMLELKKRIEHAKKGEVASARSDLDEAQLGLMRAQAEQRQHIEALQNSGDLNVHELADRARFVVDAGVRVGTAGKVVAERDREFQAREQARMLATRDVKTFEILNERSREEVSKVQRKLEQSAADEVAATRWSKA